MNNLIIIINELSKYHRNKTEILNDAINNRLNLSLVNYYKSIYDSFIYLIDRSNKKILKNLNEVDE